MDIPTCFIYKTYYSILNETILQLLVYKSRGSTSEGYYKNLDIILIKNLEWNSDNLKIGIFLLEHISYTPRCRLGNHYRWHGNLLQGA